MALGRRRKSARDHLACVTVGLECLSLFPASQILESRRKIDEDENKQTNNNKKRETRARPSFPSFSPRMI